MLESLAHTLCIVLCSLLLALLRSVVVSYNNVHSGTPSIEPESDKTES